MRCARAVAIAVTLLAACTNIIPATRENAYDFQAHYGTNGFTYLWPRNAMPLRIWVDPTGPLFQPTQIAISRWQNALLYGEFRGVIVADSAVADIIIHNMASDFGASNFTLNAMARECSGETDPVIDFVAGTMHPPVPMFVFANGNQDAAALATCYRITTTHELGHALGILSHSPNPADIMYYQPVVDGLSAADEQTMEMVFHTRPNLTIVWP